MRALLAQASPMLLAIVLLACASPAETPPPEGDAGTSDTALEVFDAGGTSDAMPDAIPDTEMPDPAPRALILDLSLRPSVSWQLVRSHLETLGYEVIHRRWYPHVTASDISPESDSAVDLIVVAAGGAPAIPTDRMRLDDIARLATFVQSGGTLVLAPMHSWSDSALSDTDWFAFNRLLEVLGLGLRIERNTMVGSISLPQAPKAPLHNGAQGGYPGGLEWTINLPIAHLAADHPRVAEPLTFAAGYAPTLACDDDAVTALAYSDMFGLLWWHHGTEEGVTMPLIPQPIATLASTGSGFVAIIPRSLFQLETDSGFTADQPVLDLGLLSATSNAARTLLDVVHSVVARPEDHVAIGCHIAEGPIFSPAAPGLPALDPTHVANALYAIPTRTVPESPPTPPEWAGALEVVAPRDEAVQHQPPHWFTEGRGHVAYGDLRPKAEMTAIFALWSGLGIDGFMVTVNAGLLLGYSAGDPEAVQALTGLAEAAETTEAAVFVGTHFITPYQMAPEAYAQARGVYGKELKAPAPLDPLWWDEGIGEVVRGAAKLQADVGGIDGLQLDLELYGAGALLYASGHAFDAVSWQVVVDAFVAQDPTHWVANIPPPERFDALVEAGLLRFTFDALEEAVASRAAALLAETRAVAPDLDLAFYVPTLDLNWFTKGLFRGFASPERPVVLLTYDLATGALREALAREGIAAHILSGLIGVLFSPTDVTQGLTNCGTSSDGFWFFQFGDFPDTDDPATLDKLHAPPADYFDAVASAVKGLTD